MNNKEDKTGNISFLGKKRKSFQKKSQGKEIKHNRMSKSNRIKEEQKTPNQRPKRSRFIDSAEAGNKDPANNNHKNQKLNNFPESDIIIATNDDFHDPVGFFDNLFSNKDNYSGVIKIIPPLEWKENYDILFEKLYKKRFLEKDFKLEVRMQILKNLLFGKKFDFSKKFNFAEYKLQSDNILKYFEKTYNKDLHDSANIQELEKLYWELCKSEKEEKVYYVADLPFLKYFSKRDILEMNNNLNNKTEIIDNNSIKEKKNLWTLQNVNLLQNSLFQFLKMEEKSNISGLTVPWLYFGMLFSTFCWHVEDLYLYSLNYMHYGSPKVWYSIPVNEKDKMDNYLVKKYNELKCKNKNLVDRLTLLIDPVELQNIGIRVNKTIQYPGEIILTFPNAFHAGFSTGFNISEAVNFSTNKWIEYGNMATEHYINQKSKTPVFPIEWLIYKNYKNLDITNFTNFKDKNQIVSLYNKIKKDEISFRKNIEEFLKTNNCKVNVITYNDDWDYSKLNCGLCKRFAIFSIIECSKCFKKCCLYDKKPCNCDSSDHFTYYNIYYRNM